VEGVRCWEIAVVLVVVVQEAVVGQLREALVVVVEAG